ncbi:MAG: AhpC/TSA family protein [Dysgonamonadaceae bacterium]|jgi:hypothetical protein|nr:AhpC/TSA family protein [Dysgonamonadaceae bacterium]
MNHFYTVKSIAFASICCAALSCSDENQFSISGNIEHGAGKTLYFDNITASSAVLLDSAVLKGEGAFRFTGKRSNAPDFYQLRLDGQAINIAVDSTEKITVKTDTVSFARNYTLNGSVESEKIKELTFLQLTANQDYRKLAMAYHDKTLSLDSFQIKIQEVANLYKEKAKEYIFENLSSATAYFALFQQINGLLIFDPYDKSDSKVFGAVANLWNANYPDAQRTKHLKQLFTNSLKVIRFDNMNMENHIVSNMEYFDISLPSVDDSQIRLSEVSAGKVILLDFTAYELENSPARNELLASLYKKYYGKGFDIYQIALDADKHFWKNAAMNLPWNCVIEPKSIYSEILKRYNVNNIPVSFIIDRKGNIVARIDDIRQVDKEIQTRL